MAPAAAEYRTDECALAPPTMTVVQAHAAMQDHLGCAHRPCAARQVARTTLVDAGHMVLAGSGRS